MKLRAGLPSAVAGLCLAVASAAAAEKPTEAGLIRAWEASQKSDPETIVLEKRAEGSYRFATKRFPFDGELKLLKATIEDTSAARDFVPGVVEVELVGLPEKVLKDYARSYAYWQTGNMLYYDSAARRWLSAKEFRAAALKRAGVSFWRTSLWSWLPGLLFILILVIIIGMLGRAQQKQKQYAKRIERSFDISERMLAMSEKNAQAVEKSLQLTEDSNRVLKELLEEVRKRSV